jgi:hypothetical protein
VRRKLGSLDEEGVGGDVYYDIWDEPRPGQKVGLDLDDLGNLIVYHNPADRGIAYTWPHGKNTQQASLLAWRYFMRKEGANLFAI